MKKALCIYIVCFLFLFSACSNEPMPRNWKDDFTVSCEYVPESQFDDPIDELDALLNGTFVFEHDEYTITNNTNEVFQNIWLVFEILPTGGESIEYKKHLISDMKQGQTIVDSVLYTSFEMELDEKKVSYDNGYKAYLVRIEYTVK